MVTGEILSAAQKSNDEIEIRELMFVLICIVVRRRVVRDVFYYFCFVTRGEEEKEKTLGISPSAEFTM